MGEDDAVPHDQGVAEARARVAARREIERQETVTGALTDHALQAEFGEDYPSAQRVLEQYLEELPELERDRIGRAAYTAQGVKALVLRALGPLPRTAGEAEAELAKARERMRTDPRWHQDEKAQMRYRAILRAKAAAGGK